MTTDSTEWQDTQQVESNAAQTPSGPDPTAGTSDAAQQGRQTADFADTEVLPGADLDPQWWSESTDGRCSDDAARFATSQPAPLCIV